MIRYLTWGVFILFTFGMVDFDVKYDDGLHFRYRSWFEDLIEEVKERCMQK